MLESRQFRRKGRQTLPVDRKNIEDIEQNSIYKFLKIAYTTSVSQGEISCVTLSRSFSNLTMSVCLTFEIGRFFYYNNIGAPINRISRKYIIDGNGRRCLASLTTQIHIFDKYIGILIRDSLSMNESQSSFILYRKVALHSDITPPLQVQVTK